MCRAGVAYLTSFYEVLTDMAAGVLYAALLSSRCLACRPRRLSTGRFSRISRPKSAAPERGHAESASADRVVAGTDARGGRGRAAAGVQSAHGESSVDAVSQRGARRMPELTFGSLLEGLGFGCAGWLLMGLSMAAAVQAVVHGPMPLDPAYLGRMTAYMGLGYVAGFVIVIIPSGLGVREFFLQLLLAPEILRKFSGAPTEAAAQAALAVLWLRLTWTVAKVVTAGIIYYATAHKGEPASRGRLEKKQAKLMHAENVKPHRWLGGGCRSSARVRPWMSSGDEPVRTACDRHTASCSASSRSLTLSKP